MSLHLRHFRTLAALVALASLGACSKDDSTDDPKPAPTDVAGMTWTVDGANVTATTTEKDLTGADIEISGTAVSGSIASFIVLTMPKAVGTYTLTNTTTASAGYFTSSNTSGTVYIAESGTITVTTLTATNVKGTFNFRGVDASGGTTATKTITNGAFNIVL